MAHHPRSHFHVIARNDGWVGSCPGRLVRAVDIVIQLDRFFRVGKRLLKFPDMATGSSHHDPEVHTGFGSQPVRVPTQDFAADFHDIVMAATTEQEWCHTNGGFRGLVLLVQHQRNVMCFLIGPHYFFGMVTCDLRLRIAQLHQHLRDPSPIDRGQLGSLGQLLRGLEVRNGFLVCTVLLRYVASRNPVG